MLNKCHYVSKNNYDELCNMIYCYEKNDVVSPSSRKVGEIMKRNCETRTSRSRKNSSNKTNSNKTNSRSSKSSRSNSSK